MSTTCYVLGIFPRRRGPRIETVFNTVPIGSRVSSGHCLDVALDMFRAGARRIEIIPDADDRKWFWQS